MSIEQCRSALSGGDLWRALGFAGAELVDQLVAGGKHVMLCSPLRADNNPGCSVKLGGDGVLLFKDFATDEQYDDVGLIGAAFGLDAKQAVARYHELAGISMGGVSGPITSPKSQKQKSKLDKRYDYKDADGKLVHQTLRYTPKKFRQRSPDGRGGWRWSLKGIETCLYRLPELLAAAESEVTFLCEGEKDADNLAALDLVATTAPMGSHKLQAHHLQWLAGRSVIICEDFDRSKSNKPPAGKLAAGRCLRLLKDANIDAAIGKLTALWSDAPVGSDISDFIKTHADLDRDQLKARIVDWGVKALESSRQNGGDLDFFAGCWDGTKFFEDLFVRDFCRKHQLIFSGEVFWCYTNGVYKKFESKRQVHKLIRDDILGLCCTEVVSQNRVSSIYSLAASEVYYLPKQLNQLPSGCIVVKNGVLELDNGKLTEHNPAYRATVALPHEFDSSALCPKWLSWVEQMIPDVQQRMQLQEIFGYCLSTEKNYHKFFVFFGDGGTGKSTCSGILEELIGEDNRIAVRLEGLEDKFTRMRLYGKQLYLCKEMNTRSYQALDVIKAATTSETIEGDVKFGEAVDFNPRGRFVMESNLNVLPPDNSDGFYRRQLAIYFDQKIPDAEKNYSLMIELKAEICGILNWAIDGYRRLVKRGRFLETDRSATENKTQKNHRIQVKSFLEAEQWLELVEDRSQMVSTAHLHNHYLDWCDHVAVVPYFKEQAHFVREAHKQWPHLSERRKLMRTPELTESHQRFYLGLRLLAPKAAGSVDDYADF